jgi:hypothetical protein
MRTPSNSDLVGLAIIEPTYTCADDIQEFTLDDIPGFVEARTMDEIDASIHAYYQMLNQRSV